MIRCSAVWARCEGVGYDFLGWFIYPIKHVYTFETEKINLQGISPFKVVGIAIGIRIAIGIGIGIAIGTERASEASIPMGSEKNDPKAQFMPCAV